MLIDVGIAERRDLKMAGFTPKDRPFKKKVFRSKRFCFGCEKVTHFKKKKNDTHSRCIICKGWRARRPKPGDNK
jgi:hypothetical protein